VVRLGRERHPPGHHEGDEHRVDEAEVVAGEDRRTTLRDVLGALDLWPEQHLHQRADENLLEEPVEHRVLLLSVTGNVTASTATRDSIVACTRWSARSPSPAPARASAPGPACCASTG